MITFNAARHHEELPGEKGGTSAYDLSTLIQGEGWLARRRIAARFKLLKKLDGKLARVLHPGERVRFVTKGSVASLAERFFAGHAVAYHINLRALVFTTERVILLHVGATMKPRELVSELSYASIRDLRSTWSGFCEVKMSNGRTHRFSGVPRADREFLRDFLTKAMPAAGMAPGEASDGLMHLCPHCFTPVPGWPRVCGRCGGGIKAASTAALLSLGLPGLGNWYLGHRWFGLFEMMGAVIFWVVFVLRPVEEELAHRDGLPLGPGFWIPALAIVGSAHLIDAAVTFNFARKGHHRGKAPVARG